MASFKVIIVGSGLAGSLLANGLLRNNVDFALYERDEKDAEGRGGYHIRIGDGAFAGFRACLDKERLDTLMEMFGPSNQFESSAPVLYDTQGNCLLELEKFPFAVKTAGIDRIILRNFLMGTPYHKETICS